MVFMTKKIVLLASGSGSLAQAIIDAVSTGSLQAEIAEIICDQSQATVVTRAQSAGIAIFLHPMQKDRAVWNKELFEHVNAINPDLVVSVGFMRVLSPEFVSRFATINSHPSLLPNFPGAHAVADAMAAGVAVTGTTVHWVDEGVDTGKIISQVEVPVRPGDDVERLHERIKIAERELIVRTIADVLPGLNAANTHLEN